MIITESAYLEHHGVKGMHWGKRGTRRVQKRIDRAQRIVEGNASLKDNLLRPALTKKGTQKVIQRTANLQAKVNTGKRKTQNMLLKVGGVNVKDLKFPVKGDPKGATTSNGQKVIAGLIAANLTLGAIKAAAG